MSSSASNTAAADAAGQDTETKASTVSAKIELFAKLIDPFAEGTKFTAINDVIAAAEGNSSAAESENAAVDAVNPGEGTKVEDPAVKLEAKEDDNEVKTNVTKSTTKKRGAPKNDEEAIEPKKKRIITKTKKAVASTEDQDDDADAAADAELPPSPPVTPKKPRVKAAAANDANAVADTPKPKSNKKAKAAESSEDSADPATSQETTKTGTPRKRAATVKDKAVARGLPTCMEDASEADKMLLHMKDNEGKGWTAIRATWKAMTGQETAASTLPNRYNRLKSIMMVLKKGDAPRLLAAKAEIEQEYVEWCAKFNADKWMKIQKSMENKGTTEKYPTLFLQKEYEKLKAAGIESPDTEMADGSAEEDGSAQEDGIKAED